MFKKILITLLLVGSCSQAVVKELIPNLTSSDLDIQTQARLDLLAACSKASSPDANDAERKAICMEMCRMLEGNYSVVDVIQPVLNNLERIGGEESVPTLVKLLSHPDEHIRDDARRALAVNPSPEAAQALGAELMSRKGRSPKTTAGLIVALGERGQEGASKLIAGSLNSSEQEVFIAAVKTLGVLNDDAGVVALMDQRKKENGFRKMEIDAALLSMNRPEVFQALSAPSEAPEVQSSAFMGLLLSGETGLASEAMASGNPVRQLAVIEAARQGKDKILCDVVAANIGNLPSHIQLQALGALAFSGNRSYAGAVEPLLKSSDTLVQDNAALALARVGTADSVPALLANGREYARLALGRLNVSGVDAALEKSAAGFEDDDYRATAIEALALRGRSDLVPVFFRYTGNGGVASSKAAVKAIGAIGDLSNLEQMVELMMAQETAPISRDMLNACVELMRRAVDREEAVNILVGKLEAASPRSQANILQALAQTGSNEALKPIVNACKSDDERLQKLAVKLLSGWKNDRALPVMIELASDETLSLASHVTLIRGCSRIFAGQKKINSELANQALEACRRDEEKKLLQTSFDKKKKK